MIPFTQAAFARDSTWLTCKNDYLVINVFEYRNHTGDGRETELKLLYGAHFLSGLLIEDNSSAVKLLEAPETEITDSGSVVYVNNFEGTVNIDYSTSLSLKGVFTLYGFKYSLDTKLTCIEMDADSLPESKL
jgi:hypothetical protein